MIGFFDRVSAKSSKMILVLIINLLNIILGLGVNLEALVDRQIHGIYLYFGLVQIRVFNCRVI